jgi:general secretion pathway protein L
MSVINIQDRWLGWQSVISLLQRNYDPFLQLAGKKHLELSLFDSKIQIFRSSDLHSSLTSQVGSEVFDNVMNASTALKVNEPVVISVDGSKCLVNQFEVPNKAMSKIENILKFELARITPFAPNQVYTGWYQASTLKSLGKRKITQIIIRKDYLTEAIEALRLRNIPVLAVIVRNHLREPAPFAMAIDGSRYGEVQLRKWIKLFVFSGACLLVGAVALTFSLWRHQSEALSYIEAQTTYYEKDAAAVRKQIGINEIANAEIAELKESKLNYTYRTSIIENLTTLLPDDSYLDGIIVTADVIKIDGASANSETLIAILEGSPLFKNVKFAAPTFQNPGEVKSRFSIKMDFENERQFK